MADFVAGLRLARTFHDDAVRPILAAAFPRLEYAAALLGWGSEVLGFDTPISADHHWGPRLLLFFAEDDLRRTWPAVDAALREHLPVSLLGFPTNFGPPDGIGVRLPAPVAHGPVAHMVEAFSVPSFLRWYLGHDLASDPEPLDWLAFPEQKLLGFTSGKVYHDDAGDLTAARQRLAWYPHDVWLALLAAQWERVSQVEAFVGRCGDVGDDLGSRLVAARLVRDAMRLAFLMERRYVPYAKWFGSAFARLDCAALLAPHLDATLAAIDWREREERVTRALGVVGELHNALGITAPLDTAARQYYGRPYRTIGGDRFADAIRAEIGDASLRAIRFDLGSIDQWTDATDETSNTAFARRLRCAYGGE